MKIPKLGRQVLIFKLDRDLNEIELWKKIEKLDDFFVSYRVNGWADTLADFRVYSLLEYTKTFSEYWLDTPWIYAHQI